MKEIYNSIKEHIRLHPKVTSSAIGKIQLWKRSHFVLLSEIVQDVLSDSEELQGEKKIELGTTISHITLQRFFENEYDEKTHTDLRFLKTLDKLCIFLGYKDLNTYALYFQEEKSPETSTRFYFSIVENYCEANFRFFKALPNLDYTIFEKVLFENSPFLGRIKTNSLKVQPRNLTLVIENNRSNYEIFASEILEHSDNKVIIKTQEFWNLLFENKETKDEYVVNELTDQVYFLRNINNVWKIWDNYNPNAGILNKK